MNFYDILLARCLRCDRPYPKSASGSIITITDGAGNMPLLGAVVNIEPAQDLHGYDSPWPAGGGKNLYPNSDISGSANGVTITHDSADESYKVSGLSTGYIGSVALDTFTLKAGTYTLSRTASSSAVSEYELRMELRSVNGLTIYASSNENGGVFTLAEDTEVKARIVVGQVNVDFGTGITYRFQIESGSTATTYAPYSNICPISGWSEVNVWVKPTYDTSLTPTATISLGQTVYGGMLDVLRGKLVVDRVYVNISQSYQAKWGMSSLYPGGFYIDLKALASALGLPSFKNQTPFICSHAKTATILAEYLPGTCFCDGSCNIRIMQASDTVNDWKAYLQAQEAAGTPVQACFMLATPQEYDVTPQTIKTLLGTNNIWADAGDTSVEYVAVSCCKSGSEEEPLEVTDNGQYIAPEGKAFNPVTVNVPLPSGTLPITENGIYGVYSYASVDVDVAGGISADDIAMRSISGAIVGSSASIVDEYAFYSCTSLTEVSFPACASIGSYAFCGCTSLTEVSFPACTNINGSAFSGCTSLTEVSFPACTNISGSAFYGCTSLTEVSFPACTKIGGYAFYSCRSLTEVSFPACTNINGNAFYGCTSLTEVSFPACTKIETSAFRSCTSLTEVSFPACTSIAQGAFYSCFSLTEANFPACTYIETSAFQGCYSLAEVSFPACTKIGSYAFRSCYNLLSFNLVGVSSVPVLSGTSVFQSTPIGGYTGSTGGVYGSVYVPSSLLTAFQTAPNWSLISSRIVGV